MLDDQKNVVCVAYSKNGGQRHEYNVGGARDKHAKGYKHGRWCPKCNYWHGRAYLCKAQAPPVPYDEVDNDNPQFDKEPSTVPARFIDAHRNGKFGMRSRSLFWR